MYNPDDLVTSTKINYELVPEFSKNGAIPCKKIGKHFWTKSRTDIDIDLLFDICCQNLTQGSPKFSNEEQHC